MEGGEGFLGKGRKGRGGVRDHGGVIVAVVVGAAVGVDGAGIDAAGGVGRCVGAVVRVDGRGGRGARGGRVPVDTEGGAGDLDGHKDDLQDPEGDEHALVPGAAVAVLDVLGAGHGG